MQLSEAIEGLKLATRANGRSPRTVADYENKLKPLLTLLGDVPVEEITVHDLRRYVVGLMDRSILYEHHHKRKPEAGHLSLFTVAGYVRALKRLFNWLVEEGIISSSPARRIKKPTPKRTVPKGISRDDLLALLKTTEAGHLIDIRDRAVILFLADTGCRVGGLCGLTLSTVNLDAEQAALTEKGGKTRFAFLSSHAVEAVRAWLDVRPDVDTDAFFLSTGRWEALTTRGVSQMLNRRAQKAGIAGPVNPHSFRHAFARDFLMDGGDLSALADIMGHSSVQVTKEFYGVFTVQELQRKHAEHSPLVQIYEREENGNDGSL